MTLSQPTNTRVIAVSPLGRPDLSLVIAVASAGGLGVLDLGLDRAVGLAALASLGDAGDGSFGVRVQTSAPFDSADLPSNVDTVVLESSDDLEDWKSRRVLVQCTSSHEALTAAERGASGIIAKGSESGGRVGEDSSFVLLQRLVRDIDLPIWVQGGIGLHTAGPCIVGGATGVVLDTQLSLLEESALEPQDRSAIAAMDGGETTVVAGHRLFVKPGAAALQEPLGLDEIRGRLAARDARERVLEVGQDAAFADYFREHYRTIARFLKAMQASIEYSIDAARDEAPLSPASAFAQQHGLRYPIVQGPMTRVSDTPQFAEAVSAAGGLPFLALALLRGPEVRTLLQDTASRLAGQTWGVGILGFVPPELREEQIEVIREIKPPIALIAGGRPSQARPLEELGIETYLHVPSPGLLDMFLKQGARRFVFEGQECGGHIGPRTSFVLWESQIQRLLEHKNPSELSLLFAGGIHDALSGAMVSALVAPLTRRGAKVGVLMGTAYLFTQEAVQSGAIKPGFQDAALACDSTALLETAPGHSTRCADTDYVRLFTAERARLTQEGLSQQEVWEALETLNLGRLRIASKGLAREGDAIVDVDATTQRREGMVMLGQVAALRSEVTTIAELHDEVSEGATRILRSLDSQAAGQPSRSGDIAIVGMAAIMPGAPETGDFWSNIIRGVNSIAEVPPDRWNPEFFYEPNSRDGERTPSKWGGFVDPVAFDPLLYGIPPLSLAAIDPVQLLSLEVSRRAIADAGYNDRYFDREQTSVIFGAEAGSDLSNAYGFRALYRQYVDELPAELEAVLPSMTEDSFAGILSNVISGRIANRLDLGGVNYTVDAACAASLAAINLAMKELAGGTSDMVICGGADLHNGIADYLAFSSVHALSPSGQCRTFDASADGIVLGEGVAAVVLKRLEDAERDGDRIYAVVKSVGGASDGKSLGLTAPRAQGQVRALDRAYRLADISPAQVGLIEAHGTGTVVGDRTELESLDLVFRREHAAPGGTTLGSVKSQIGHTKCTAGLAGLMKVALSLYNRVLPATLNVEEPNPGWDITSPFSLNLSPRPWPGSERKAGVSAFGFGGTNFHAVVEEYDTRREGSGYDTWPAELFLFRGEHASEALARVNALSELLGRDETWRLRDLSRSTSAGTQPVRIAIVAQDVEDLRTKLGKATALQTDAAGVFVATESMGEDARVAFLYPGQGSQSVGMLRDLFVAFPGLQRYLELDPAVAKLMFPPTAWDEAESAAQAAAITDTRAAQPALGIAGLAVTELLNQLSIAPDMVAGHSYGELVALQAAGVYGAADLVKLSSLRAACILGAAERAGDRGSMAAIGAAPAQIEPHIEAADGVVIANQNSAEQTVISGTTAGVATVIERLTAAGITARQLDVACAFHSPLVADAGETFLKELAPIKMYRPSVSVYSNTGANEYPADAKSIRKRLAQQIGEPVQFQQEIEAMYEAGARVFVEAGPGRVLTGLTSRILGSRPHVAVAVDASGQHGITQLLKALAQLATAGLVVDHERLYDGRDARLFALDDAPSSKPKATSWWVNGQRAWPVSGTLPPHAMLPVRERLPLAHAQPSVQTVLPATGDREAVVLEYLRSVRELVDTQRRVMLGYLGADAASIVQEPPAYAVIPAPRTSGNGHSPAEPAASPLPTSTARPASGDTSVDLASTLLGIISDRTGYPMEMLGLDLDLEADLSIDSIKRIEILGALSERLGLGAQNALEELPDDLVRTKTLQGIIDALALLLPRLAAAAQQPATPLMPAQQQLEPALTNGNTGLDTRTALLDVVSTRTGYPIDMLELNLDLEADLSIDSIKRIEILGALVEKLGLNTQTSFDELPEDLIRTKTLQGIIDAFTELLTSPPTANGHPGKALALEPARPGQNAAIGPVPRYVTVEEPAELGTSTVNLRDKAVSIIGESRARETIALRVSNSGGRVLAPGSSHGQADYLVDLTPLSPGWQAGDLVHLFERARAALVAGSQGVVVACTETSRAGIAGMVRSFAKEWPDRAVKAVILGGLDNDEGQAECVFAELANAAGVVVVTYTAEGRFETRALRADLAPGTPPVLSLDERSVVLITGGARGITARVASELATRFKSNLEIIGRTPEPLDEEPMDLRAAQDMASLRRAVIARGELKDPAAIEASCSRIMAGRAVRETLAGLRAAGSAVTYHAVDVRDEEALSEVVADVYARLGRIDVVVHAAGVIEDKLAIDKTEESFRRVLDTKIKGAQTLAGKLRDDVQCMVLFSSVAAAFGNRGQVDYATANDYLDCLAEDLNRHRTGRVVSIGWGPWAYGGMVSPQLEREYATRGIELIEPGSGVESFMTELLQGPQSQAHVILMRAFPSALT